MCRLVLVAILALSLATTASAQTFIWDGGLSHNNFTLNNNWSTGNNWVNGPPVSSASTAIIFTRSSQFTTATQNIANPFVLNSLTFDATSNVTELFGSAFDFRVVPATQLPPVLNQNSATNVIIHNAITVTGTGFHLIVGGNGSGLLTLAGNIQTPSGFLFNKIGSMTLSLSGNNFFAGGIIISQGIVRLDSAGDLGSTGPIIFTNGGPNATSTLQYTSNNQTDYSSRFLNDNGQPIRIDTNGQNIVFASGFGGLGTSFTKLGAGTLTLTGDFANGFTGTTSVLAGSLVLNKSNSSITAIGGDLSIGNPVNPGPVNSVNVSISRSNQIPASCNLSIYQDGRVFLGSSTNTINTLTMSGGEVDTGIGTLRLGGNVVINSSSTGSSLRSTGLTSFDLDFMNGVRNFSIAASPGVVYDLDSTAGFARGTLIKSGEGVLRLQANINPVFSVTLQSGTLAVGSDKALGSNLGTFTLAGGTVVADGGNRIINNPVSLIGNATIGASLDGTPRAIQLGSVALGNSVTLTVSNNALSTLSSLNLGSNTLSITGTGDLTISGLISGSGGLNKSGVGQLNLNGNNVFTGGLNVLGGSIVATHGDSLGAANNVIAISNNSSIRFIDSNVSVNQIFNLGLVTLAPATGGSITYNAATVNNGVLGTGGHILGNGTRLESVRVSPGAAVSQASGTATLNNVLFTGASSFTQSAGTTLIATGDFTMNPQTAMTIAGTVSTNGGSLTGQVTVNNAGRLTTDNAPLFLDGTRGTTINAGGTLASTNAGTIELGGLLVNNGTHTGVLNINFGGLAKGSGSFGTVNVNEGGRFSPGNSPGTAVVGSMTMGANGTYVWEVNDVTGTAGNNWDVIHVTGALNVTAGTFAGGKMILEITSLNAGNAPGVPANFDPSHAYQWPIAVADGGITGFDPAKFTLDTSHFSSEGVFSLSQSGNELVLSFSPVPEPFMPLLVLMLGVGVVIYRYM